MLEGAGRGPRVPGHLRRAAWEAWARSGGCPVSRGRWCPGRGVQAWSPGVCVGHGCQRVREGEARGPGC